MPVWAYIGIGSNLGNRADHIEAAVRLLTALPDTQLDAATPPMETPPWGGVPQPPYLNAVARIRTALGPRDLLTALKDGERRLGRTPTVRWGPRVIDLDILLYGDVVYDSPDLVIPHPRIPQRDFVLAQLVELCPSLVDPRSGRSYAAMLRELRVR